ncbi:methyl-accepting chemotaxis protein [Pseudoroseomonas globiformis]|uniref:Methyl-accepting chemotaxis protein n=1 Tax=Teichococcus globiformis TaxID=2307229 RepID=A0ABV7FWG1_9PROT
MPVSAWLAGLPRRAGLVPSLVALILASVLGASTIVSGTVLWQVHQDALHRSQGQLHGNLRTLKALLAQHGTEWRLVDGTLILGNQPLNGRVAELDAVRQALGGVATIFAGDLRVATNITGPDGQRATGSRLAAGPAHDAALRHGRSYSGTATILGEDYQTIYEPIQDGSGAVIGLLFVGQPLAPLLASLGRMELNAALLSGGVALVLSLLAWLLIGLAVRPLRGLAVAVQNIGEGALDTPVPCANRHDQLGEIGRAVERLAESARQARLLEAEAEAGRARAGAERRAMQQALAGDLEQAVGGVTAALRDGVTQLEAASATVAGAAAAAEAEAGHTAERSLGATDSVHSVAAAAEELAASIAEISRRVAEGAAVARDAVSAARTSGGSVTQLSQTAERIGDVVKLIADIAGQTNLLALNATIEAARAGEAGKGFAVVATEVKSLANQTAKATEEIASQIAALREATGAAVATVRGIADTVGRMDEVTAAIAAAVEEQGAATQEIARNAATAASFTGGAAESTRSLTGHVAAAAAALEGLRGATASVALQRRALQGALSGVVEKLRAS